MELIKKGSLYAELCRLEELARNRYLDTPSNSPASVRYCAQLNERTALKHLIADAPTIDAVPVVRCGVCKWHYIGGTGLHWCERLCAQRPQLGPVIPISIDGFCSYGEKREEATP